MINFPCAKINLGLNITAKRTDGYHDLETVFYPIPLTDALEIQLAESNSTSTNPCDITVTGIPVAGNEQDNLVVKAYNLLAADYELPHIQVHLTKRIPSQAGLGGGSSDCAFMIRLLNKQFQLDISTVKMEQYAAQLGSDCAFFINAKPAFATGRGELLEPISEGLQQLDGYYIAIVKPNIDVSTGKAFAQITCIRPSKSCLDIVKQPIETWAKELINDFEQPIFAAHSKLEEIKVKLYQRGAIYAAMSGSGSALFGLFAEEPIELSANFADCFTFVAPLK